MSNGASSVAGVTVFVRVCPQQDPAAPAPISRKASAILDKKGSFASSYALKNSFISSKTRKSSLSLVSGGNERCIITPDDRTVRVLKSGAAAREGDKEYTFDKVFPEDSSQEEVCINIHDHVLEAVNGYNVTVLCHGASKSGKSYTMTGTKDCRGIIPHAVKSVFTQIDKIKLQEPDLYFYVELGYVELYNNMFRDLLFSTGGVIQESTEADDESVVVINEVGDLDSLFDSPASNIMSTPASRKSKTGRVSNGSTGTTGTNWSVESDQKIQVHESKNLGVFLAGSPTLRVPVSSAQDVFQLYSRGQKSRSIRVTETGHISSRSHAIMILYLECRAFNGEAASPTVTGGSFTNTGGSIASASSYALNSPTSPEQRLLLQQQGVSGLRMSKLTFVDMAGADRLEISGAVGDTLVESQNINLSLHAFGDVLFALSKNAKAKQSGAQKGAAHVPFLNSKLTMLLKESLGGNCKTVMITTIHSTVEYLKVTETSLQYGTWARTIRGRVTRGDLNMGERWIQETDPEIIRLKKLLEERSREFAKLRVAQVHRAPPVSTTFVSPGALGPSRASFVTSGSNAATLAPTLSSTSNDSNSPLRQLQKRLSDPGLLPGVPGSEGKASSSEVSSLKNRIADLELTNQELKDDNARKARQSADLSISLKKSLELIQQQNKALTDQLNDVAHEKDAQIDVLAKKLADVEKELFEQVNSNQQLAEHTRNQGAVDEALNGATAELERAKKSAWDRYLTITQQQEQIAALEASLQAEMTKSDRVRREMEELLAGHMQESKSSTDEQRRALEEERASLQAALKAAEDHVYEQEIHLQEQHASQAYQISSLKDKCEALRTELASKDGDLSKARRQVQDAQEQFHSEFRTLKTEGAKASDLQASLDMHIALVASLKLKLAALQVQFDEEIASRESAESKIAALQAEVSSLNESVQKANKAAEVAKNLMTAKVDESKSEVNKLSSATAAKDATIRSLEARITALADTMAADRQAALLEVQSVQAELRDQLEAHQQLTSKYLQRNSEAELLEEQSRALKAQMEALSAELTASQQRISSQEQELGDESSMIAELTEQLQRANQQQDETTAQYASEVSQLTGKLESSVDLSHQQQSTIAQLEQQVDQLRAQLEETFTASDAEAASSVQRVADLNQQLSDVQSSLATQHANVQKAEQTIATLRDDVAAKEGEGRHLHAELQALEDRLAREVQRRKAEVEAAHEQRKEALGASQADFEQFLRISEAKVADLSEELIRADQKFEDMSAELNDRIQEELVVVRNLTEALQMKGDEALQLVDKIALLEQGRSADATSHAAALVRAGQQQDELNRELAVQADVAAQLQSQIGSLRDQIDQKNSEISQLTHSTRAEKSDLNTSLDTQVALVASLRLKLDVLQGSLSEEVATRQNREQRVSDLELINADLGRSTALTQQSQERSIAELTAVITANETTILDLQQELGLKVQAVENLKNILTEMTNSAQASSEQIQQLQGQLNAGQARIDALDAQCQSLDRALGATSEKHQSASASTLSLRAQLADLTAALAAQEQKNVAEVNARRAESAAYEQQIAALQDECAHKVAAIQKAEELQAGTVAESVAEQERLFLETEELRSALKVKDAAIALLKEKAAALEQRIVADINARTAEKTSLEAEIEQLHSKAADLATRLCAALDSGSAEAQTLNAKVLQHQRDLQALSESLSAAEASIVELREQLAEAEERCEGEERSRASEAAEYTIQLRQLLTEVTTVTTCLQETRDDHTIVVNELQSQLHSAVSRGETAARALSVCEEERSACTEKLAAQEQRTVVEVGARLSESAAYEQQASLLRAQIAALADRETAAAQAAASELATQQQLLCAENQRVEELSARLQSAEDRAVQLETDLSAQHELLSLEIAARQREAEAREKDAESSEDLAVELRGSIANLESRCADLEIRLCAALDSGSAEAQTLNAEVLQHQRDLQALSESLSAAEASIEELREQLAEAEGRVDTESACRASEVADFAAQLDLARAQNSGLEEQLEKTRRMHNLSSGQLREENEECEARIDELEEHLAGREAELEDLVARFAALEADSVSRAAHELVLQQHAEAVETLEQQHRDDLRAAQDQLRTAQAQQEDLHSAMAALEAARQADVCTLSDDLMKERAARAALAQDLQQEMQLKVSLSEQMVRALESKDAEIQVLQARLSELEYVSQMESQSAASQMESAATQLRVLTESHDLLTHSHRHLQEEEVAAKAQVVMLTAQAQDKGRELDSLREQLASVEAACSELATSSQQRISALEAEIVSLQSQLDDTASSLAGALHDHRQLHSEHTELHALKTAGEQELQDLQACVDSLQSEVEQLTCSKQQSEDSLRENRDQLQALSLDFQSLEQKLVEAVNGRTAEGYAYRVEVEQLEIAISQLTADLHSARRYAEDCEQALQTSRADCASAVASQHSGALQIVELERGISQRDDTIQVLSGRLQDLADALDARSRSIKSQEERAADLESQLNDKQEQLAAALTLVSELEASLQSAATQVADLAQQVQEGTAARDELIAQSQQFALDLEAAQKRVDEVQALFEAQVAMVEALKVKLSTQASEAEARDAELAALKEHAADLQSSHDELTQSDAAAAEKIAALEKALGEVHSEFGTVSSDLQQDLDRLQSENDALKSNLASSVQSVEELAGRVDDLVAANQSVAVAAQERLLENNSLLTRHADLEAQLRSKAAEVLAQSELVLASNQRNAELTTALAEAAEQIADLRQQICDGDSAREALVQQVQQAAADLEASEHRVDDVQSLFESQIAMAEALKVKLRTQADLHSGESQALMDELAAWEEKAGDLQHRHDELTQSGDTAAEMIATLERVVRESTVTSSDLQHDLERLQSENDVLKANLAISAQNVQELTDRMGDLDAMNQTVAVAAQDRLLESKALASRLEDLQEQLTSKDSDLVAKEGRASAAEQRVTALEASLQSAATQVADLEQKVQDGAAARDELIAQSQQSALNMEAAQKRVDEVQALFETQVAMVEALKVKLSIQASEAEARDAELAALKEHAADLQSSRDELTQSDAAAAEKIAALEKALGEVHSEFGTVSSDLQQDLDRLQSENNALKSNLASSAQSVEELAGRLSAAEQAKNSAASARDELQEQLSLLRNQLAGSEALLGEQRAKLESQAHQLSLAEKFRVALKSEIAERDSELNNQEHLVEELEERVDELTAEAAAAAQAVADADRRVDEVQALFEAQIAMVQALQVKLGTQEELHTAETEARDAELVALKESAADLQSSHDELTQSGAAAAEKIAALEKALGDVHREFGTVSSDLQQDLDRLQSENDALKSNLASSAQSVEELAARLSAAEQAKNSAASARDELQEQFSAAELALGEQRAKLESQAHQLSLAEKFRVALKSEIAERDNELNNQEHLVEELEERVDELTAEAAAAAQAVADADRRVDEVQALFEAQIAMVQALQVKLGTQEELHTAETEARDAELAALNEHAADLQSSIEDLKQSETAAAETIAALRQALNEVEGKVQTLVAALASEKETSSAKLRDLRASLVAKEDELRALKVHMSEVDATNKSLATAAHDRAVEANHAKTRLSDAVEQLLQLKADLDAERDTSLATEQRVTALKASLQSAATQVADLEQQVQEGAAARDELIAQSQQSALDLEAAQKRVDEVQALFETQVAMVEALKVKLSTQKHENAAALAVLHAKLLESEQREAEGTEECGRQRTAIASLQHRGAELGKKADALEDALTSKTQEVAAMKDKLKDAVSAGSIRQSVADATIAQLQGTQLTMSKDIADLTAQNKALQGEVASRAESVKSLAAEKALLLQQLQDMEDAMRNEGTSADAKIAELITDLDQQIALVASLRLKMRTLQEQKVSDAHSLVHESASLEQCQAELSAAQGQYRQLQHATDARVAALQDEVANTQRVYEVMAAKLHEKNTQAAAGDTKIQALSDELSARQSDVHRLEAEIAAMDSDRKAALRAVEARARDAEAKLASLKSDRSSHEGLLVDVEAQRNALKSKLADKTSETARMEEQLEKLRDELKEQSAQLSKVRTQFSAAQVRLEEEGHRRIRDLASHEQRVSELEVAKVAADHVRQRYEAKIGALTSELNALTNRKQDRMSI